MSNDLALLAPFEEKDQEILKQVDLACQMQMSRLKDEATRVKLAGEPLEPDMETLTWLRIIKAYGILYNRAVEAGWIDDTYLLQLPEEKKDG